jgi:hypothetical protein
MFNINISISGFENFSPDAYRDSMSQAMNSMAIEMKNFWTTIAGQRLKSSRKAYQDAIKLEGTTSDSFTLVLDGGFLPCALEMGTPPYYMEVPIGTRAPMNSNRQIIFNTPEGWATGTGEPWKHPGFPGFNMLDDVVEELVENVAPRHIDEAVSKL